MTDLLAQKTARVSEMALTGRVSEKALRRLRAIERMRQAMRLGEGLTAAPSGSQPRR